MKIGKHSARGGEGAADLNTLEGIIEQRAAEKAASDEAAQAGEVEGQEPLPESEAELEAEPAEEGVPAEEPGEGEAAGEPDDGEESEAAEEPELPSDEAASEPAGEPEAADESGAAESAEATGAPESADEPEAAEPALEPAGEPEAVEPVPETAAEPESAAEPEAAKRGKGGKVAGIACAAVAGVAVIAYLAGAFYFSSHFFPKTMLNGEDVSGMSVSDLAAQAMPQVQDYALKVRGDNVYLKVKGEDVALGFDVDAYAQDAASQVEKWTWPLELSKSHSYTVAKTASYDGAALQDMVDAAVKTANKGAIPPQDAQVTFDTEADSFKAKQPEYGTTVDAGAVYVKVCAAVTALDQSLKLDESALLKPAVTEDDEKLAAVAEKANRLLVGPIDLEVNKVGVYKISRKRVASWIVFDEKLKPSIDEEAIRTWTLGALSKKLDSVGSTRKYKMKGGRTVTVSGGTYGWSIDAEKLAKKLAENVKDGDDSSVKIPMKSEGVKWNPGGRDWDRYIDIDLANQVATLYDKKNKVLWRSEIVSGNTSAGHGSPTGVYVINSKAVNQTLIGSDENGDGKPDYKTPVSYWMPFVDNSVAFHDANWRGAFGGSIYMTNGSHGCINLPPSAAASLYDMIRVGDVVSCHY